MGDGQKFKDRQKFKVIVCYVVSLWYSRLLETLAPPEKEGKEEGEEDGRRRSLVVQEAPCELGSQLV